MKSTGLIRLFSLILLVSCAPSSPLPTLVPLTVQYTSATTPWLKNLYNCAGNSHVSAELRAAGFQIAQSADLIMRLGQPDKLTTPSYQVGTDDLLVIANNQNRLNQLTDEQVRSLFIGRIQTWKPINGNEARVQVWVFPTGEDVQEIFEQFILGDSPVTSLARLANSPEEMSQAVSNDIDAIGIITRRWKTENTLVVYTAARSLPVLAITQSEPRGNMAQILACLQK
jgi:ABC-type phosphate transport system substrate-binding protein